MPRSTSTLNFYANGNVCLVTPDSWAAGRWSSTGAVTFNWKVKEDLSDADGNFIGWVNIDQNAVRKGGTFYSQGISRIYNPDGTLQREILAKVKATRNSTTPPDGPC